MTLEKLVIIQNVIFVLMDIIICVKSLTRKIQTETQKAFVSFAIETTLVQLSIILGKICEFQILGPIPQVPQYLIYSILMILLPMCACSWFEYFLLTLPQQKKRHFFIKFLYKIPIFVMTFCCICSPWTHWIFYITPDFHYQRGTLFSLQSICPYIYFLFAIIVMLIHMTSGNRRLLKNSMLNFIYIILPSVAGAVLQIWVYSGGYTQIGISFGLLLMYLNLYVEEIKEKERLQSLAEINQQLSDANDKISAALSKAEAASHAKTSFLFNMSHDIRTPMNAIIGFTNLLEKHQEEKDLRADYIKKIQDSSTVLLSIINNVLEMARIEKGTLDLVESALNVNHFINDLSSVFTEMMAQKGITFIPEVNISNQYIYCDAIKIREILLNILSNSFKYTNEGGKVIMKVDEIPSDKEGWTNFRTTISDTGIGMSEEFIPHIFEEFSREKTSTANKIEGTGLGMSIVKRLLDFMDGTIHVESKLGEGTTFIITVPHRIAEKSMVEVQSGAEIDSKLFKDKRVLLAEDNELNAEIMLALLREADINVDHAENGKVCLDKLIQAETGYYDLILMDIQMPVMGGYEATKLIRSLSDSQKANIPILAMTANAFQEDKIESLRCGMNGHISKPINVSDVFAQMSLALKK